MRFANAEIEVVAIACARGTLVLAGLRGGVPSEKRSKRGEAHETSPLPRSLEKWLRKPEGTQSPEPRDPRSGAPYNDARLSRGIEIYCLTTVAALI